MAKYRVDLSSLERSEREAAFDQINGFAFMALRVLGKDGLEAADVIWTSDEDFISSPVFPRGCAVVKLSD